MTKKLRKLTEKQEAFCLKYYETGNATEAYLHAFPKSRDWKTENAVSACACQLKKKPNVIQRLEQLRTETKKKHMITVDSLLYELEEARLIAIEERTATAAVSATMGKAKITGLDKQVIDLKSTDGSMSPSKEISIKFVKANNKKE